MSDRRLQLLLIDDDPIFRLGLRVFVEQFPDLQVAAEADRESTAMQILNSGQTQIDLAILDLGLGRLTRDRSSGLQLCQQIKTQYPQLPILLLCAVPDLDELAAARQIGVEGYCAKGTAVSELVKVMRQVAAGQAYWQQVTLPPTLPQGRVDRPSELSWRDRLRLSGLRQIEAALNQITAEFKNPSLSDLDRAILAGRRRELRASRWLIDWLLAPRLTESAIPTTPQTETTAAPANYPSIPDAPFPSTESAISVNTWQSVLFDTTFAKMQYGVQNLTDVTLEIDIFREEKKRELLCLILRKLDETLDELRYSQVQLEQMPQKRAAILRDLWQAATTEFFGKYYTLEVRAQQLEVVDVLLQDVAIVQTAILDKIPLVIELFNHFLFQVPLLVDNVIYSAGTTEAMARSELLLQNLLIQVANAVVQPLLNHFADAEPIKQNFYNRQLISTREIERFRNNLSWKYRLEKYINEPKAIFESRYVLFVFNGRGIRKVSIYAPRAQELEQLSGVQQTMTLLLESRDAIAPRLRSFVAFVGKGVVYVLTQVIGRGIGLIGRGIVQGIGNSLQDSRMGNNSNKPK